MAGTSKSIDTTPGSAQIWEPNLSDLPGFTARDYASLNFESGKNLSVDITKAITWEVERDGTSTYGFSTVLAGEISNSPLDQVSTISFGAGVIKAVELQIVVEIDWGEGEFHVGGKVSMDVNRFNSEIYLNAFSVSNSGLPTHLWPLGQIRTDPHTGIEQLEIKLEALNGGYEDKPVFTLNSTQGADAFDCLGEESVAAINLFLTERTEMAQFPSLLWIKV